ncbi:MAG: leucine/isoleucine/valine transporter permease subunit [Chloroflexi bacterium]|nr:leucine/isoleucine/valine transporter permease subunit [Chloroflexota bacterium]
MTDFRRSVLRPSLRTGLIFGGVALFLTLVGIIEVFSEREVIDGVVSMSYTVLWLVMGGAGYSAAARYKAERRYLLGGVSGAIAGLVTAVLLGILVVLGTAVNLRSVLVNATPALMRLLTFGQSTGVGVVLLLAAGAIVGLLGGLLKMVPERVRRPLLTGVAGVLVISVLHELIAVLFKSLGFPRGFIRFLFARKGLTPAGALISFVLLASLSVLWPIARSRVNQRVSSLPPRQRRSVRLLTFIALLAFLLFIPDLFQLYWTDVIDNVGLFILMGLGLNIVVGFAGLLDLGYVAFFAIGAYVTGLLTSPASSLGWGLSFWVAWPVAMVVGALAGVLLGIPVLRMRGDYLAIVTLGFGEIIRVLANSDLLKPYIGGAQGILQIPKPSIAGIQLITSQQLYYLILLGCLVAIFVSWRLSDSRVGRAWIAMREDEDVAQAMGINLIKYKLLAFAIGATFSAMSGAIFATKLSSIFPHSFNLLISINVLSLIIVGGMASIPGVIVGALILVGLPEVLREFAEYRLLMYGALLVIMMLVRPEGFWPAARRRLELREDGLEIAGGET